MKYSTEIGLSTLSLFDSLSCIIELLPRSQKIENNYWSETKNVQKRRKIASICSPILNLEKKEKLTEQIIVNVLEKRVNSKWIIVNDFDETIWSIGYACVYNRHEIVSVCALCTCTFHMNFILGSYYNLPDASLVLILIKQSIDTFGTRLCQLDTKKFDYYFFFFHYF